MLMRKSLLFQGNKKWGLGYDKLDLFRFGHGEQLY